ncbi:hypothetical protein GCM10022242_12770 [Nocardioides panacisoli]|uniref:Uncharacterized protein n=1 Tax=Nocardioides panacisoli TaxID=627624 RepID=A0ABP7I7T5_9ACTN
MGWATGACAEVTGQDPSRDRAWPASARLRSVALGTQALRAEDVRLCCGTGADARLKSEPVLKEAPS